MRRVGTDVSMMEAILAGHDEITKREADNPPQPLPTRVGFGTGRCMWCQKRISHNKQACLACTTEHNGLT